MVKFISSDKSVQSQLSLIGHRLYGSLDEQIPVGEFYIAYSDRQPRRASEYIPRILRWNVRVRSAHQVHSIGWYKNPASALAGLHRAVELDRLLYPPPDSDQGR